MNKPRFLADDWLVIAHDPLSVTLWSEAYFAILESILWPSHNQAWLMILSTGRRFGIALRVPVDLMPLISSLSSLKLPPSF